MGNDGEPNPGDTCTFRCNDGYKLSDSDSRTCTDTGTWNGTEPTCERGKLTCHVNKIVYYTSATTFLWHTSILKN